MKTIYASLMVVLFLTATPTFSYAQTINLDESSGCIVSKVKGKVTFMEKGSTIAKPVRSGTILPEDATVVVGRKSSFTLACEDRLLPVSKKGKHSMTDLSNDAKLKGEQSRFAQMMSVAKGYGGGRDTTKAKGWGDKDTLIFKIPAKGKIALQQTTFKWNALNEGANFKLILYKDAKKTPVLSAMTSGNSFSFDPKQLAIKTGQVYYAQVMLANDMKTTSEAVAFSFVSPDEVSSALASLQKNKEYLRSNAIYKSLMEAVEFENRELHSLASERYQKAIKMDSDNTMVQQMYAAFLDRINK